MAKLGTVFVDVKLDDKDAKRQIDGLSGSLKKGLAVAFAGLSLGGLVGGLKASTDAASDLSESTSKVGVVFEDSAAAVEAFAATAPAALGQTRQQALEAAGTFGNLLTAFGLTEGKAADMSTSMVGLASDLASFNNANPQEVLDALSSGLSGETEPLKRFGIAINDARLKQEALNQGLIASTSDALTPAAKAQAAYALIMQDTVKAQGDFARTAGGAANQQRILAAQFGELKATVGAGLLPVITAVLPAVTSLVSTIGPQLAEIGTFLGDALTPIAETLGTTLKPVLAAIAPILGSMSVLFLKILRAVMPLLPVIAKLVQVGVRVMTLFLAPLIGALEPVITALVAAFMPVLLKLTPVISQVANVLGGTLAKVLLLVGPLIEALSPVLMAIADAFALLLAENLDAFVGLIDAMIPVLTVITQVIADLAPYLAKFIKWFAPLLALVSGATVMRVITPLIESFAKALRLLLAGDFSGAFGALADGFRGMFDGLKDVAGKLATILGPVLASIGAWITGTAIPFLRAKVPEWIGALWGWLKEAVPQALAWIGGALTALGGWIVGTAIPWLLAKGGELLGSLVSGLGDLGLKLVEWAGTAFAWLASSLVGLAADVLGWFIRLPFEILGLLVDFGAQLVTWAAEAFVWLWQNLPGLAASVWQWFMSLPGEVVGLLVEFGPKLIEWAGAALATLGGRLGDLAASIWDFFRELPGKIVSTIGDLGSLLVSAGASLMTGLWNGITSVGSAALDIAKDIANALIGFVNDNIIDSINSAVEFDIAGISVNPPDIPHIPTFHTGGVFRPQGSGEGLALLKAREAIFTPDQLDALPSMVGGGGSTEVLVSTKDSRVGPLLDWLTFEIGKRDKGRR